MTAPALGRRPRPRPGASGSSTPPRDGRRRRPREVKKLPTLRGRTVVNLFFEDSTRTRISFEAAAKRLSADVINFSRQGLERVKGETLKDTALTLEAMGADASSSATAPPARRTGSPSRTGSTARVINAGDGTHEHPTQALLDAFTMRRRWPGGSLDGRRVGPIVGDVLHSRVARSNVLLLQHPRRPGHPGRARRPCCRSASTAGRADVVRPGRRPGQGRRRDDAARAARADDAAFFPTEREYARRYGLDAPPGRPAARARHRHAPRADEPRHGDHRRGRRRAALAVVEQVANGVSVRMAVLYLLLPASNAVSEEWSRHDWPTGVPRAGGRASSAASRPTC